MKLNSYYLHAFANQGGKPYDAEDTIFKLNKILKDGKLLSRRLRKDLDTSKGGWNGLDYISLCDYRRKNARTYNNDKFYKGYTAYETYIKESPSFILKKNKIEAIKPQLVRPIIFDWDSHYEMYRLGNSKTGRYSDLPDEVQVKDSINLDRVVGLTLPLEYMIKEHKLDEIVRKYLNVEDEKEPMTLSEIEEYITTLKQILEENNIPAKIYDLETQTELTSDNIEEMYTYTKKMI